MVNILVNCDSLKEAICTCNFLSATLFNKGIFVKKVIGSRYKCEIQTENVFVEFLVHTNSNQYIRGRCCDIAYGFGRDDSLYLTRGKSEGPTLPLLDLIVRIEKGEI